MSRPQRRVVRKDAAGEYIRHDTRRFAIAWTLDKKLCPAPGYPVMALPNVPGFGDIVSNRLLLYRHPLGDEFIGYADAPPIPYPGPFQEDEDDA